MRQRTAKSLAVMAAMWLVALAGLSSSQAQSAARSAASGAASTTAPALSGSMKPGYSTDPPAISTDQQWLISLRYDGGRVTLVGARKVRLPQPRSTPRNVGRFAAELLSGPTVVERLRFDFPMIGADESVGIRRSYNSPPRFERHTVVVEQILLPDTQKASRARLIDRGTGREMMINWPPVADLDAGLLEPQTASSSSVVDAGADSSREPLVDAGSDAKTVD